MAEKRAPSTARVLQDLAKVVAPYRRRMLAAVTLLVLAKITTVCVPLLLKRIIDALSQAQNVAALPVYLLAGHALQRFSSTLFNELCDMAFSRVTQRTVATYAQMTTDAVVRNRKALFVLHVGQSAIIACGVAPRWPSLAAAARASPCLRGCCCACMRRTAAAY